MKEVFYGANNQSHFPVFFPVSFPPLYRGRGNRGKVRKLPFRDISGIAGKVQTFFIGAKQHPTRRVPVLIAERILKMKVCVFGTNKLHDGRFGTHAPVEQKGMTEAVFKQVHGGAPVLNHAYKVPPGFQLWRTARGEHYALEVDMTAAWFPEKAGGLQR